MLLRSAQQQGEPRDCLRRELRAGRNVFLRAAPFARREWSGLAPLQLAVGIPHLPIHVPYAGEGKKIIFIFIVLPKRPVIFYIIGQ